MREDIRLGNEALAEHDLQRARQYFQQVLVAADATEMQKRIAANRLREITEREQPAAPPRPSRQSAVATRAARQTTATTPRTRRKASDATADEEPAHHFVRPPDKPIVVINRH